MTRQRVGKVARLPADIREEINRRLYDGQTGKQIIAWLAKQKCPGNPSDISDSNVTQWRKGGYQDWVRSEGQMEKVRERAELAMRMAKAAGGSLPQSVVARLAGQIDEKIDALAEDDYKKFTPVLNVLLEAEGLRLKAIAVGQRGEALELLRQKFQRDTAKLFLKWYSDKHARTIADEPESGSEEKVERLGRLMFGEDWK